MAVDFVFGFLWLVWLCVGLIFDCLLLVVVSNFDGWF